MPEHWRTILRLQGGYYLATGVWPLLHIPSFEAVTGPKTDDWLVHMVGLLAAVNGAALGLAAQKSRHLETEMVILAAGTALAFAAIDIWYVLKGVISPIYLADAAVQLTLLIGIGMAHRTRSSLELPEVRI